MCVCDHCKNRMNNMSTNCSFRSSWWFFPHPSETICSCNWIISPRQVKALCDGNPSFPAVPHWWSDPAGNCRWFLLCKPHQGNKWFVIPINKSFYGNIFITYALSIYKYNMSIYCLYMFRICLICTLFIPHMHMDPVISVAAFSRYQ